MSLRVLSRSDYTCPECQQTSRVSRLGDGTRKRCADCTAQKHRLRNRAYWRRKTAK